MFLFSLGTIVSPKRNWKQCLCKILGGHTKSTMVFSGVAYQKETSHFYDFCIVWKCVEETGNFLFVGACTENKILNEDHRNKKVSEQETGSWLLKSAVEPRHIKFRVHRCCFTLNMVLYSSILFAFLSVVLLLLTGQKQISYLISSH